MAFITLFVLHERPCLKITVKEFYLSARINCARNPESNGSRGLVNILKTVSATRKFQLVAIQRWQKGWLVDVKGTIFKVIGFKAVEFAIVLRGRSYMAGWLI